MGRYCLNRRGRGKYDPSRAGAGGVPGRPGCGHGDRPVPPGFSGVSAWQPAFVACAFSAGSGDCSICGPGNNDGRSRTPGHSRSPGKTVDVVALHGSASPRFRRAGTTAPQHGQRGLIYIRRVGWFLRPGTKSAIGGSRPGFSHTGRVVHRVRQPEIQQLRRALHGSIPHCRRRSQCRSVDGAVSVHGPLTRDGCLHGLGGGAAGATDNSRSCPSCPVNRIIPAAVWPG